MTEPNNEERDRHFEEMRKSNFWIRARNAYFWVDASLNLKRAADKLYDQIQDASVRHIQRIMDEIQSGTNDGSIQAVEGQALEDTLDQHMLDVYYLLMGFAFENLLKGLLMERHPENITEAGITNIRSHTLVDLCRDCKIEIQAGESELLEKLTRYAIWQGRYPTPLKVEKMWPIKRSDGTWPALGEMVGDRTVQSEVNALYYRIWTDVEKAISKGPSATSTNGEVQG